MKFSLATLVVLATAGVGLAATTKKIIINPGDDVHIIAPFKTEGWTRPCTTPTATPIVTPTPKPTVIPVTPTPIATPTATPLPPVATLNISSPTPDGVTVSGSVTIATSFAPSTAWENVYIDGNYLASSPPPSWIWNSATVPNGAHTIRVDVYGITGTTKSLWISQSRKVNVANGVSPSPTPAPTATVSPTPVIRPTPIAGYFPNLPQGSALPMPSACAAAALARPAFEPRTVNATQNHTMPSATFLSTFHATVANDPQTAGAPATVTSRIDGQFTGSTDQILVWGACKWGLDEDTVRADAVMETHWNQAGVGDLGNGTSAGILQAKIRDSPSTCPSVAAAQAADSSCTNTSGTECAAVASHINDSSCQLHLSTAFAVDYALAMRRACFDGEQDYLAGRTPSAGYPTYPNGTPAQMNDGCIAYWYSGTWFSAGGIAYLAQVNTYLANKTWLGSSFARHTPPESFLSRWYHKLKALF